MAVERKYERDIDVFLAEEFSVSSEFSRWFLGKIPKFIGADASVRDVFVSRSDASGESDLVVVFERRAAGPIALLIEDKIDASFQPAQYERYVKRAQNGVSRGEFEDFEVVLCAPLAYRNAQERCLFEVFVSYEDIAAAIENFDTTLRGRYRASFILNAATKSVNTWERVDDEPTNEFWEAAYQLASKEFPILEMKKPKYTKNNSWISLRPHDFPTQPRRISLDLKAAHGYVDLVFTNTIAHKFEAEIRRILKGMTVHQTGRSTAIRLTAPPFAISDGLDAGLPKIRLAFGCAAELAAFYRHNRSVLDNAADAATPSE